MAKVSNKEKALIALVESPSVVEAAEKCGLSKETLFRYLKEPEFTKEYRALRRQTVENAISEIQQATSDAVTTLKRNLTCGKASDENRAAQIILEHAVRGVELIDIVERLENLEKAIEVNE